MGRYDFGLGIAAIVLLALLGIVNLYSIVYYQSVAMQNPQWIGTGLYEEYVAKMNAIAFPLTVLLIAALALCIPKRIFSGETLIRFIALIMGAALVLSALFGLKIALGFLLIAAAVVQLLTLSFTLAKKDFLQFEKEGHKTRLGSAALHLGIVLLLLDLAVLQGSAMHMQLFWLSAFLLMLGIVLSFYASK